MTEGDSTREELLEAGMATLAESLADAAVDALTVRAITRHAGRSIGSFYHYWPDRRSYRSDLLDFFAEADASCPGDPLVDLLDGRVPDPVVVLDAFGRHVVHVADDEGFRRRILLLALAEPEASTAAGRMYARSARTMASVVARILEAADREPIEGVDLDDLAACLTLLVDGLAMRLLVDDAVVTSHLVATAVTAVLVSLSRPVGEERSFADLVEDLEDLFVPPARRLDDAVPVSRADPGCGDDGPAGDCPDGVGPAGVDAADDDWPADVDAADALGVAAEAGSASAAGGDDRARTELLESGAQLLMSLTAESSLRSVTVSAVTRRTGCSTGAFYHYWETQADYARELVARIADPAAVTEMIGDYEDLGWSDTSWAGIVDLVEMRVDQVADAEDLRLQWFLLLTDDATVRSGVNAVYERYHERTEQTVRYLRDAIGARLLHGLQPRDLAILIDAVIDSFDVCRRGRPEAATRFRIEALLGSIVAFTVTRG